MVLSIGLTACLSRSEEPRPGPTGTYSGKEAYRFLQSCLAGVKAVLVCGRGRQSIPCRGGGAGTRLLLDVSLAGHETVPHCFGLVSLIVHSQPAVDYVTIIFYFLSAIFLLRGAHSGP